MVKPLTIKHINKLLKFYKINTKTLTKKQKLNKLHYILAKKICRCIYKVKKPTTISTPICRSSIFHNFSCKKRPKLLLPKHKTHKLFML